MPTSTGADGRLLPFLLLALAAAGGCEEDVVTPGGEEIASVEVNPPTVELGIGEVFRFDVTPRNANGLPLVVPDLRWTSLDPAVATVDSSGSVTGVGEGTARLVLQVPGFGPGGSAEVRVIPASVSEWREHVCAVDVSGRAWCWGRGLNGELGIGERTSSAFPRVVEGGVAWSRVSAGASHSCGVSTEGQGWCWGRGREGQLGTDRLATTLVPDSLFGGYRWVEISAGGRHACGVTTGRRVRCWGWNAFGQLGNGSRVDLVTPVLIDAPLEMVAVSAGARHTCGLTSDGRAWCWGRNRWGQLGDGTATDRLGAVPVAGGRRFTDISAGARHTCAVDVQEQGWCWGDNSSGQLGNGTLTSSTVPREVRSSPGFRLRSVAAGANHTCGLGNALGDGIFRPFCWGSGASGQLGTGSFALAGNPARLTSQRYLAVTAGTSHSCGIDDRQRLLCWGFGGFGQLGTGAFDSRPFPALVEAGADFARLDG